MVFRPQHVDRIVGGGIKFLQPRLGGVSIAADGAEAVESGLVKSGGGRPRLQPKDGKREEDRPAGEQAAVALDESGGAAAGAEENRWGVRGAGGKDDLQLPCGEEG